ncbi:MAG TPA: TylF/MycF/NovP-related O-methyltransferase [Pirellulales bacterium]|nr:TylF/MycF/NovP-related O-methyltransferase [Pirellulales bacterium]
MSSTLENLSAFNDIQRSQADALDVLLLARSYTDLLKHVRSKRSLDLAYVGYELRLLALTEALLDCAGPESNEVFFEGCPDDIYHPSQPLDSLVTGKVDLAFIADVDGQREHELTLRCRRLVQGGDLRSAFHHVRLLRLANAHQATAARCVPGAFISCLNIHKLAAISLATYLAPLRGAVIECGSYLGGTAIWMALLQQALGRERPIFAMDTFEGMPSPVEQDGTTIYQAGLFEQSNFSRVENHIRAHGLSTEIRLVPGLVQHTFADVWKQTGSVAFALVDTDQYSGTRAALDEIVPRLEPNGLIIVDDSTVSGVNVAINEAMARFQRLRRVSLRRNFDVLYAETDAGFLSEPAD